MPLRHPPRPRRPVLEEFEPRILYAADLAAVWQGLGAASGDDGAGAWQSLTTAPQAASTAHEIAFVDLAAPDAATLVAGLQAQKDAGRAIDIVTIEAGDDGIAVIGEALASRSGVSAVHLLGHGSDGLVQLGSVQLDANTLLARAGEIADWSRALGADADLLIYGCDVAASETGRQLVQSLAALSGADVAASTDATGSASLGGDWDLEVHTGPVEVASAADTGLQSAYRSLLGQPFQVNVDTSNDQDLKALNRGSQQAVASAADGSFVVVWASNAQDGDGSGVYARRIAADGSALTGEILVNASVAGDQGQARVVSDNAGNFVVAWADSGQNSGDVLIRRFAANGSNLGGEIRANTSTSNLQTNPVLAMNATTGAFVVAWQGEGPGDSAGIFFRRFAADGTPQDGTDLRANLTDSGTERDPAVAMAPDGRFVIAFVVNDHMYFQRFDANGNTLGSRTQVDNLLSTSSGPAIAMDDSGNFTLVYRENNIATGIWGRGYLADGSQRYAWFQPATGDADSPSLAMAADGAFTLTYQRTGSDGQDIFLRRYGANGAPLGAAFQVNTDDNGAQESPSVARLSTGSVVVVWSGKSDADSKGIQARIVGGSPPVITSNGGGANAAVTRAENTTTVTTVTATDADGDPLTFAIVPGGDAALFEIDALSGLLRFRSAPDFEAPLDAGADNVYDLTVQVNDRDGTNSDTQAIRVTVTDRAITSITTTGGATVEAGGTYTLNLAADEDATGWTINWGDGSVQTIVGDPSTVTHTYTHAGFTFNILASASDGQGTVLQNQLLVPSYNGGEGVFRYAATTGGFVQEFAVGDGLNKAIQGVIGPDGLLYISGENSRNVLRYNAVTGAYVDTFVAPGSGGLNSAGGLAFGPDGDLYVASYASNQVLRYDGNTGAFTGAFIGNVNRPYALTFGPDGDLYVGLYDNDEVRRYDAGTGAFIGVFVADGSGGLDTPEQIVFGPDGDLYVASAGSDEVLRYNGSTGAFRGVFVAAGSGGLDQPTGLTFGPDGHLYVSGLASDNVLRYHGSTGAWLGAYVSAGAGGLNEPALLTFLPEQQVTVLPASTNEAPVITSNGGGANAVLSMPENSNPVTAVTATDADAGSELKYSIVGGADAGRFEIGLDSGLLRFMTAPDFEAPNDADANRVYEVTVQVRDGSLVDQQALSITVQNVVEPPVATDDLMSTARDTAATATLVSNDWGDAAGTLTVIDGTRAQNGTLVFSGGAVTYTPDAGYTGNDHFQYLLDDGQTGLQHYWRLDGDAVDGIGSADGSLAGGPVRVQGRYGDALAFDGVNDRVLLPDTAYGTDFTLSFWFNMNGNSGTGYRYIYSHGDPALQNSLNVYFIESDTVTGSGVKNVLRTSVMDGNDSTANLAGLDVSAAGLADNNWHQYVLTVKAGVGATVFVDGVQHGSVSNGADGINAAGSTVLGARQDFDAARFYSGRLDTVALHDRSLNADERTALYTGGSALGDVAVTITTGPVAAAPVAAADSYTLGEDQTFEASPGVLNNDSADSGQPLTATLVSGPSNAASFTLNPDGTFSYVPLANFAGSDSFRYTASDGILASSTTTVTLTVTPSNDAPVITSLGGGAAAAVRVFEGSSHVTTVAALDVDTPPHLRVYSIVGGADAGLFEIDAGSGVLRFNPARDFETPGDQDGDNRYELTVRVSDGSLFDDQALRVDVDDNNEFVLTVPVDVDNAANAVSEAASIGSSVGLHASSTDADGSLNAVSYSLADNAGGRFAIDAATGVVSLAAALDHETAVAHVITVVATSADGSSQAAAFTIAVLDENEAALGGVVDADASANAVHEGAAVGTSLGLTLKAIDPDVSDSVSYSLLGDAGGRFVIDSASGVVTVAAPLDAESFSSHTLVVRAASSDGSVSSASFMVEVLDVNEFDISALQDANPEPDALAESAPPGSLVGLHVQASDLDLQNNRVRYGLDDTAGGRFAIDADTGVLTLAAALDHETQTQHVVVVRATSEDGSTSVRSFTIAVLPVNEAAPQFTGGAAMTAVLPEGEQAVGVAAASDTDRPAQTLRYELEGEDAVLFDIDAGNGTLRFVAAPDHESPQDADRDNHYHFAVRADDGEFSTRQDWTVTVSNVNEAPVLAPIDLGIAAEDTPVEFTAADLLAPQFDIDGDRLVVTSLALDQGLGTLLDLGSGRWRFTPQADWSGVVTFAVGLGDGGFSGQATATLGVTPANDAPLVTSNSLVLNAGTVSLLLVALDPDTAAVSLVFAVAGTTGGQFERSQQPGVALTTFTQADVDAGQVVFVADGSGTTPSFALSLSDGDSTVPLDPPLLRVIAPVPAVPTTAPELPVAAVTAPPAAESVAERVPPVAASAGVPTVALDAGVRPGPLVDDSAALPQDEARSRVVQGADAVRGAPLAVAAFRPVLTDTSAGFWAALGDVLLAEGTVPGRPGELSFDTWGSSARIALAQALDRMQQEVPDESAVELFAVGSTTVVGTGLSVGYVLWLARGGVLVASLMSSVPAWASVDPLPVLSQVRRGEDGDDDDADVDPIERLFARARRLVAPVATASTAGVVSADDRSADHKKPKEEGA